MQRQTEKSDVSASVCDRGNDSIKARRLIFQKLDKKHIPAPGGGLRADKEKVSGENMNAEVRLGIAIIPHEGDRWKKKEKSAR